MASKSGILLEMERHQSIHETATSSKGPAKI